MKSEREASDSGRSPEVLPQKNLAGGRLTLTLRHVEATLKVDSTEVSGGNYEVLDAKVSISGLGI